MQPASFGWILSIVPPLRFDRLFHAVVVMGASLPGCGGREVSDQTAAPSGISDKTGDADQGAVTLDAAQDAATTDHAAPVSDCLSSSCDADAVRDAATADHPASAADCPLASQFFCADDAGQAGCHCDASAPKSAADCANPYQFQCVSVAYIPQPGGSGTEQPVGCQCNAAALTPDQCPNSTQFTCTTYDPYFDGCRCDPSAPTSAADCMDGGAQMIGFYLQFHCASQTPLYGCKCEYIALIR